MTNEQMRTDEKRFTNEIEQTLWAALRRLGMKLHRFEQSTVESDRVGGFDFLVFTECGKTLRCGFRVRDLKFTQYGHDFSFKIRNKFAPDVACEYDKILNPATKPDLYITIWEGKRNLKGRIEILCVNMRAVDFKNEPGQTLENGQNVFKIYNKAVFEKNNAVLYSRGVDYLNNATSQLQTKLF